MQVNAGECECECEKKGLHTREVYPTLNIGNTVTHSRELIPCARLTWLGFVISSHLDGCYLITGLDADI